MQRVGTKQVVDSPGEREKAVIENDGDGEFREMKERWR